MSYMMYILMIFAFGIASALTLFPIWQIAKQVDEQSEDRFSFKRL